MAGFVQENSDQSFEELTLEDQEFGKLNFENCTFKNCNFQQSRFVECKFFDCSFENCNLSVCQVPKSVFSSVEFRRSKLVGIDWHACRQDLGFDCRFWDCNLDMGNFSDMDLKEFEMEKCSCKESRFINTILKQANLKYTDFEKTRFHHCDLTGADFRSARNYAIDIQNNMVTKAKFSLPEALSLLESLGIQVD